MANLLNGKYIPRRSLFSRQFGRGRHSQGHVSMLQKTRSGAYAVLDGHVVDVAAICFCERGSAPPEVAADSACEGELVVVLHPQYGGVAVCERHRERIPKGAQA